MSAKPADYLLVIGEREALAWILRERRMAFPGTTRREVDSIVVGDRLFLTTTRGCFHNPTRDATRVIATAKVLSAVTLLETPLQIAGREFTRECELSIGVLAPYLEGVELAPLVDKLDAFAGAGAWGMRLRRPLVSITAADARLLERKLGPVGLDPESSQQMYLDRIRPVASPVK
jgi:hypothetical protein